MKPKWHGKCGHKDSWDPLQIASPPQIVQRPVGVVQKPTPQVKICLSVCLNVQLSIYLSFSLSLPLYISFSLYFSLDLLYVIRFIKGHFLPCQEKISGEKKCQQRVQNMNDYILWGERDRPIEDNSFNSVIMRLVMVLN